MVQYIGLAIGLVEPPAFLFVLVLPVEISRRCFSCVEELSFQRSGTFLHFVDEFRLPAADDVGCCIVVRKKAVKIMCVGGAECTEARRKGTNIGGQVRARRLDLA